MSILLADQMKFYNNILAIKGLLGKEDVATIKEVFKGANHIRQELNKYDDNVAISELPDQLVSDLSYWIDRNYSAMSELERAIKYQKTKLENKIKK